MKPHNGHDRVHPLTRLMWVACMASLVRFGSPTPWDVAGVLLALAASRTPTSVRPLAVGICQALLLRRELLVIVLIPLLAGGLLVVARRLAQGRRRLAGPAILLVFLWVAFAGIEGYLAAARAGWFDCRLYYTEKWPDGVPFSNKGIGAPLPDQRVRVISHFNGGDVDWDVVFTTDSSGRRTVVGQRPSGEVLALYGCSNTFGHGLDDAETLGSALQERLPGRRVINMGVNAFGPDKILLAMRGDEPRFDLPAGEPVTDVVYFFIPHHFHRNAFSSSWSYRSVAGTPTFRLGLEGLEKFTVGQTAVVEKGRLGEWLHEHTLVSKFARVPRAPERHVDPMWVELTARIVGEMKATAASRWGARFHVVLTGYHDIERYGGEMDLFRARLDELGVDVVDMTGVVPDYSAPDLMGTWFDRTTTHLTARHVRAIADGLSPQLSGGGS